LQGGGGAEDAGLLELEPVPMPAPLICCIPPTRRPVTPPYELPAPALLIVSPQD